MGRRKNYGRGFSTVRKNYKRWSSTVITQSGGHQPGWQGQRAREQGEKGGLREDVEKLL